MQNIVEKPKWKSKLNYLEKNHAQLYSTRSQVVPENSRNLNLKKYF